MSIFHTNTLLGASGSGSDPIYADDVFSTDLWDGTGSTQTITNGIDLDGEGGMVWTKVRNAADSHTLMDSERGKTGTYFDEMASDSSYGSQATRDWGITSFNSNGFSLGGDNIQFNDSSYKYCSWTFRKCPGFFDIVTYTGNGSNRTISHNLGSAPGFMIVKRTSSSEDWTCFHRSMGGTKWVQMNGTSYLSEQTLSTIWNNTAPDASVFSVGTHDRVNTDGQTYIAYLFAHDAQDFGEDSDEAIIKCDTVTISGSGTFDVNNLGFEPQYVIFKQISGGMTTPDWHIHDNMRGLVQRNYNPLLANKNTAETTNSYYYTEGLFTVNPHGFKSTMSTHNAGNYIYIAIRRPHKPPTAGTDVFDVKTASSYALNSDIPCGFAPDFMIATARTTTLTNYAEARLTDVWLNTASNVAENTTNYFRWDGPGGKINLPTSAFNNDPVFWQFRRATGFFDVVAYDGTGSSGSNTGQQNITHALGAVPELIIVKTRDGANDWVVYNATSGAGENMRLNRTNASMSDIYCWDNTTPTSSVFRVGSDLSSPTNTNNKKFIAYLFASLDGVSKVGSYTGTGNDLDVDCGFSAGARFVLIKREDSTSNWYLYDSARGIVSGNDPYLLLNSENQEVTPGDYIDPLNSGFTVTSNASSDFNTSGGTYIFLAIA